MATRDLVIGVRSVSGPRETISAQPSMSTRNLDKFLKSTEGSEALPLIESRQQHHPM